MSETQQTMVPDQMVGMTIGNYVVRHKLGEGGMGSVYYGEHPSIGKRVAIKVLHAEFASQPEIISRFFNEAKAVNDIQHGNIVDIIDFGTLPPLKPNEPPIVYFVMELIAGVSLAEMIHREAPFGVERACGIAAQIADALAASHRVGIVHRDLKPENVMINSRGRERDFVKLLDFGIAKLTGNAASTHRTRTGMVIGTPQYMSPEQCEGRGQIDHRTDVYALGVVLYQMLTGKVPFVGEGFGEILVQQMAMPPLAPTALNPQIPLYVELVVLKALEKKRENRYQQMDQMMSALQNPVAYVDANGGQTGFLTSPILRDPAMSGAGAAVAMLTPPALRAQVPTTLGGSAAQLTGTSAPKRRAGMMIGGAVAVALVGIVVAVVLRGDKKDTPASDQPISKALMPPPESKPSETTPPPEVKPPEVTPARTEQAEDTKPAVETPPVVESKVITLAIDSTPPGATVTIGGVKKGVTPYRGDFERGDKPVELKLVLAGYEPLTRKIEPKDDLNLGLQLEKKRLRPTGPTTPDTGPDDTKNPFDRLKKGQP